MAREYFANLAVVLGIVFGACSLIGGCIWLAIDVHPLAGVAAFLLLMAAILAALITFE